jgi:DNA-binding PadR family transcriptional regulator
MDTPKIRRRPITRDLYAILVALAAGAQVGSEIQDKIIEDTMGLYVRTSSLYTALRRLVTMGLAASKDKQYHLTDQGWHVLRVETQTLEPLVIQAKRRVVISGHGRW